MFKAQELLRQILRKSSSPMSPSPRSSFPRPRRPRNPRPLSAHPSVPPSLRPRPKSYWVGGAVPHPSPTAGAPGGWSRQWSRCGVSCAGHGPCERPRWATPRWAMPPARSKDSREKGCPSRGRPGAPVDKNEERIHILATPGPCPETCACFEPTSRLLDILLMCRATSGTPF